MVKKSRSASRRKSVRKSKRSRKRSRRTGRAPPQAPYRAPPPQAPPPREPYNEDDYSDDELPLNKMILAGGAGAAGVGGLYKAYDNRDLLKFKAKEFLKGKMAFANLFGYSNLYPPYWRRWNELTAIVTITPAVEVSKDLYGNLVLRDLQRIGDPYTDGILSTFYKSKARNIIKYTINKPIPSGPSPTYTVYVYIIPMTTADKVYLLGLPFPTPDLPVDQSDQFRAIAKDNIAENPPVGSVQAQALELLHQWATSQQEMWA